MHLAALVEGYSGGKPVGTAWQWASLVPAFVGLPIPWDYLPYLVLASKIFKHQVIKTTSLGNYDTK